MKVLHLSSPGPPARGGAALTDQAFLHGLAALGWETHWASRAGTAKGRGLHTYQDFEQLRSLLLRLRPDVLFASQDDIYDAVRLARRYRVGCLAYLHSFEYCPPSPTQARAWSVGKSPRPAQEALWALGNADGLAANSEFFQGYLQKRYALSSRVLYPEVESARFLLRRARQERFITGVCGLPHKGTSIFLGLAQAFPEHAFLLIGAVLPRFRPVLERLPNLAWRPYGDPREFLGQTRVLLVPSQWAEPFGRIAVEALANGIPVLASRTGGLPEIVGPSCVKHFRHLPAWQTALARFLSEPHSPGETESHRQRAAPFLRAESSRQLSEWLTELVNPSAFCDSPRIRWRGEASDRTAYTMLNRRWSNGAEGESALPCDVTVHHEYTEPFSAVIPPEEGKFVAIRTWDFGPYPPAWVHKVATEVDQLWVYSRWTRDRATESGIPAGRIRVVAPGVDLEVFQPQGPAYPIPSDKSCRLLFLGASISRKGIDTLLAAYARAFTADDDVCLVIKDRPDDVFYAGQDYGAQIAAAKGPEVVHIRENLSQARLAALVRSCQAGVFPFRAEGFALPILESMACGLPVVVPSQGPCWDYCGRDCSYSVPARLFRLPVRGNWAFNTLGMREELREIALLEMRVDDLAKTLRLVVENSALRVRKGRRARERALDFSWEASRARVQRLLAELGGGIPLRIRAQREEAARLQRVRAAARRWLSEG